MSKTVSYRKLNRAQTDTFRIWIEHYDYDIDELRALKPAELADKALEFGERFRREMRSHFVYYKRVRLSQGFLAYVKGGNIDEE